MAVVQMPADDDLCRRALVAGRNVGDDGVAEGFALPERTPGLGGDTQGSVRLDQLTLLEIRVQLDLIQHRGDSGLPDNSLKLISIEVRNAD